MPASVRFGKIGGDEADGFDDPIWRRQIHEPQVDHVLPVGRSKLTLEPSVRLKEGEIEDCLDLERHAISLCLDGNWSRPGAFP
jgi:hypothetical protein